MLLCMISQMDNTQNPKPALGTDFFARVDSGNPSNQPASPNPEISQESPRTIFSPESEKTVAPEAAVPFSVPPAASMPATPPPSSTVFPPSSIVNIDNPPPVQKGNLKKILLFVALGLVIIGGLFFLLSGFLSKIVSKNKQATLTYWGLWEPDGVVNEIIADYQKTHPKVKINYVMQSQRDYRERLQSALAADGGPDIFRYHNTWVPMIKDNLSPVPASVMDAATFERLYYPVTRTDLRLGNAYVGIPLEIDNLALFINEEIFDSAGKTPPKTWDEFRKLAIELTTPPPGTGKIQTAGAAIGVTANVDHWSEILGLLMLQNSANPANPVDNLAADSLTFYTQFYRTDRVWDETLPNSTYYFAIGRVAMYFAPSWRIFEIKAMNPNLKFRIESVPQLPGGEISWASYWVEGVSKKSMYANEAWEFLKYVSSKEAMQKLYQLESSKRLFGEPYGRTDMADLLKKEPFVGVFVDQAVKAKSWYLCSRTFDNGINDKIIKYYEDAVNAVNSGQDPEEALKTADQGVAQILRKYGLTK